MRHFRDGIRVAVVDGRIAGFAIRVHHGGFRMAWLHQIGVARESRSSGLGRRILEDFERQAASAGFTRIELAVEPDNAAAIRLYERCGYAPVPREGSKRTFGKAIEPAPGVVPAPRREERGPWAFAKKVVGAVLFKVWVGTP